MVCGGPPRSNNPNICADACCGARTALNLQTSAALESKDLIGITTVMKPCGLGQYAKPLETLDPDSPDLKVQSLITLRKYIEALLIAQNHNKDLYLPGLLSESEKDQIVIQRTRVSIAERELTVLLTRAQARLEMELGEEMERKRAEPTKTNNQCA